MNRKSIIIATLLSSAVGLSGFALAQENHSSTMTHNSTMNHSQAASGRMDHSAMMSNDTSVLPVQEPGQGAFAAIGEIVAKLEADPKTDWSKVNIAGLREHLRDMDVVSIDSVAVATDVDGGIKFTVTGGPNVAPSIQRMTLAHAKVMGDVNGWQYDAVATDDGAVITVLVPDQDLAKLKGLGFFGMMASGSHHQAHHWLMASGADPHM